VSKFSYPFAIKAPEIVIYLWSVLINHMMYTLLFTWLDRLRIVLVSVQCPQWHQLVRLSRGTGAFWKENLSSLTVLSGESTSDVGVECVWQVTKFLGGQRFWWWRGGF